MRRAALMAAVAVTMTVAGPSSHAGTEPWKALHRPLKVPRLAAGAECPVSKVDASVDFDSFGIGLGPGPGPAYPVGIGDGILELAPAANFGSRDWMGQKTLWFVVPGYRGPVLVRGRQLDGPYRVRFDRGSLPPLELRIGAGESSQPLGSRGRPSYTRLRAPGCYGYQIDDRSFSRVIVFRAVRGS